MSRTKLTFLEPTAPTTVAVFASRRTPASNKAILSSLAAGTGPAGTYVQEPAEPVLQASVRYCDNLLQTAEPEDFAADHRVSRTAV